MSWQGLIAEYKECLSVITALICNEIKPVLLPYDEEKGSAHIRGVVHQ
jgi:hypothetical protein